MQDFCSSVEECKLGKKRKVFIAFADMIDDMISIKKFHPVVTELQYYGAEV